MYRAELSGVLGGLTRVRAIQLNDAHIFCQLDQIAAEASAALDMIRAAYGRWASARPLPAVTARPRREVRRDQQMRDRAAACWLSVLESVRAL